MFDSLSQSFKSAGLKLQGKALLSEDNIKDALGEIRRGLLDADVEYGVVKSFLAKVEAEALGRIVKLSAGKGSGQIKVSPREHFIQICQKELESLMGPVDTKLKFPSNRPGIIMMVGLQGTGKTTTTAKLAKYLREREGRKPLLVAADIYRPAAIDQLKTLGTKINVPVFSLPGESPVKICEEAVKFCFKEGLDTLLIDTAGRLTVDTVLMDELKNIKTKVSPDNIILVCDAMMGQDAVTTAQAFNAELDLSGFVMTKLDGDARGGAALSIKEVTHKPIKFLGMGEGMDRIEEFRPEGLASRILGKGDVVGLMDDFEKASDQDQEENALKMLQGQFSFDDFYKQISMIQKMGSLKDLIAKMPMQNMIPKDLNLDDNQLIGIKAMIDSMTKEERIKPEVINDSRSKRIAKGSGRSAGELKDLVKRFRMMRSMMGSMGKNMGLLGKIPGMGALKNMQSMRSAAAQLSQGGGLGGLGGGFPGFGGMPGMGGGSSPARPVDRDKLKKLRKAAKAARKKNRKK